MPYTFTISIKNKLSSDRVEVQYPVGTHFDYIEAGTQWGKTISSENNEITLKLLPNNGVDYRFIADSADTGFKVEKTGTWWELTITNPVDNGTGSTTNVVILEAAHMFTVYVINALTQNAVNVQYPVGTHFAHIEAQRPWTDSIISDKNEITLRLLPEGDVGSRFIWEAADTDFTVVKDEKWWDLTITHPLLKADGNGTKSTTNVTIGQDQP